MPSIGQAKPSQAKPSQAKPSQAKPTFRLDYQFCGVGGRMQSQSQSQSQFFGRASSLGGAFFGTARARASLDACDNDMCVLVFCTFSAVA
jgi:hypothetical protein